jgi:hypothetical protein
MIDETLRLHGQWVNWRGYANSESLCPNLGQSKKKSAERTVCFDCSRSASRSIVLAFERFDVFRCAILAASHAAIRRVAQLEAYGLEARFWPTSE